MSISAISASTAIWPLGSTTSSTSLADTLFAQLDTRNQGYLSASDIKAALAGDNSSADTDSEANAVFAALDTDGDGQLTKSELSTALDKVSQQLGEQMLQSRLGMGGSGSAGGPGGMPPPPPPDGSNGDQGLTQKQIGQMASDAPQGSQQASDLSALAPSFDQADTDGDGKVTFQEAMAFRKSQSGSDADDTTTGTTTSMESGVGQLVKLIAQYLGNQGSTNATVSVSA